MHNRGAGFDLRPGHPNELMAGRMRGQEAADLLTRALARDMSGVQTSILSSPEQNRHAFDPPYEANALYTITITLDEQNEASKMGPGHHRCTPRRRRSELAAADEGAPTCSVTLVVRR